MRAMCPDAISESLFLRSVIVTPALSRVQYLPAGVHSDAGWLMPNSAEVIRDIIGLSCGTNQVMGSVLLAARYGSERVWPAKNLRGDSESWETKTRSVTAFTTLVGRIIVGPRSL